MAQLEDLPSRHVILTRNRRIMRGVLAGSTVQGELPMGSVSLCVCRIN
jgi:hypothetical protein